MTRLLNYRVIFKLLFVLPWRGNDGANENKEVKQSPTGHKFMKQIGSGP